LSRPVGVRHPARLLLPPRRLRRGGQPVRRTGRTGICKAQTSIWLTSKLIKEDHFACRPQGCSRLTVSPVHHPAGITPDETTSGPPRHSPYTSCGKGSHPRGRPTIHLPKSYCFYVALPREFAADSFATG